MITVVPLSKYCDLSGEKQRTVQARIAKGIWLEGKQVYKIKNMKERWIDLTEVEKWARNGGSYQVA